MEDILDVKETLRVAAFFFILSVVSVSLAEVGSTVLFEMRLFPSDWTYVLSVLIGVVFGTSSLLIYNPDALKDGAS